MTAKLWPSRAEASTAVYGYARWSAKHLVPPAVAWLAGWVGFAIRSGKGLDGVFSPAAWGRWDSGQYLWISARGYAARWHCTGRALPPQLRLRPGNYLCGNIGFFPGYPLLIRAVSAVTRVALPTAALLVSWLMWYLFLVVVWRLLAGAVTPTTRWACLLLATWAPGAIYFAALFPISTAMTGMAACMYLVYRSSSRWAATGAFVCGLVAGSSYVSSLVLAPALLLGLMLAGRAAWRPIAAAVVGLAGAFAGVLIAGKVAAGVWNAYFVAQSKYATGSHNPIAEFVTHLKPLWEAVPVRPGLQHATATHSLYTAVLLGSAIIAFAAISTWRRLQATRGATARHAAGGGGPLTVVRTHIDPLDITALASAVGAWVVAYSAGAHISVWRSESFVVFAVLPLRRLSAWVLVPVVAAAACVAWTLARYFFNAQLV